MKPFNTALLIGLLLMVWGKVAWAEDNVSDDASPIPWPHSGRHWHHPYHPDLFLPPLVTISPLRKEPKYSPMQDIRPGIGSPKRSQRPYIHLELDRRRGINFNDPQIRAAFWIYSQGGCTWQQAKDIAHRIQRRKGD